MEEEVKTVVETPVDTIEYRGYSVPVYMDDYGQQYWCVIDGEEIGLGSFNPNYQDDIEYLIDTALDVIERFDGYSGSVLMWFFNGVNGNRDIKLKYRTRTLKIWLVENETQVISSGLKQIKEEALEILEKYAEVAK